MSDSAFYHSLIGSCGQLLSCYLLSRQKSFVWFIKLSILAGLSPIVDVIGQSGSRECDLVGVSLGSEYVTPVDSIHINSGGACKSFVINNI